MLITMTSCYQQQQRLTTATLLSCWSSVSLVDELQQLESITSQRSIPLSWQSLPLQLHTELTSDWSPLSPSSTAHTHNHYIPCNSNKHFLSLINQTVIPRKIYTCDTNAYQLISSHSAFSAVTLLVQCHKLQLARKLDGLWQPEECISSQCDLDLWPFDLKILYIHLRPYLL